MGTRRLASRGTYRCRLPRLPLVALALCAGALVAAPHAMAFPINKNLLKNPGAERGDSVFGEKATASVPSWETTGNFTQHSYEACKLEDYVEEGHCRWLPDDLHRAIKGGYAFFVGGPGLFDAGATQTVNVSGAADLIDGGSVTATLAANIGSAGNERDAAAVQATLLDESGAELASITIGPVSSHGLPEKRAFPRRTKTFPVPAGTRSIRVELIADSKVISWYPRYNDAAFDNVVLKLKAFTAEMAIAIVQEIIADSGLCSPYSVARYAAEPSGIGWHVIVWASYPGMPDIDIDFDVASETDVRALDRAAENILSGCTLRSSGPRGPDPARALRRPAGLDPGAGLRRLPAARRFACCAPASSGHDPRGPGGVAIASRTARTIRSTSRRVSSW